MKIDFELTKQDYLNFNMDHLYYSKTLKQSTNIQRYIIPLVFLIVPFALTGFSALPTWGSLLFAFIIYAIWAAFYFKFFKWHIAKNLSRIIDEGKNKGLIGKRSILLNDKGIVKIDEFNEVKTDWNAVESVVESKDYIYLYNSAVSAYVIPIRVFASVEEKESFKKYVPANIKRVQL